MEADAVFAGYLKWQCLPSLTWPGPAAGDFLSPVAEP